MSTTRKKVVASAGSGAGAASSTGAGDVTGPFYSVAELASPPACRYDFVIGWLHHISISPRLFATVFGVIFLAELPDKTALAALVLATRHRALPVFLGASLALTVQSMIAVGAGSLLAKLPAHWVHIGSGVLFVGCGVLMWLRKHDPDESDARHQHRAGFWSALWTVFVVVFVAEWGDLTQIGTAGFEAKYHAWLTIFLASSAALWAVAAIAVFVGNRAGKLLDAKLTQRVAAVVFVVVGGLLIAGVI